MNVLVLSSHPSTILVSSWVPYASHFSPKGCMYEGLGVGPWWVGEQDFCCSPDRVVFYI